MTKPQDRSFAMISLIRKVGRRDLCDNSAPPENRRTGGKPVSAEIAFFVGFVAHCARNQGPQARASFRGFPKRSRAGLEGHGYALFSERHRRSGLAPQYCASPPPWG
jgi:hypothetical protein